MENIFRKKIITSIIFIGFLFLFSIFNGYSMYTKFKEVFKDKEINLSNLDQVSKLVESTANENVYGRYRFIDGYGYLQKVMDKNEENNFEVIKDKNGFMHYTFIAYQPNPVYEIVTRTQAFKEGLVNKNTKFIYLMTPDKYIRGYSELSTGIPYNYANETADNFLDLLSKKDVDNIDLRQNLTESGIPLDDLFFKTDHHWKIETVFWEFGQLVNILNKDYNMNLDSNGFYTNKENYNFIQYKDSYIGSMGRKTGVYYDGADDFTLIYPKFKTAFSYYSKTGDQEAKLEGRFEEALLTVSPFRTEKGVYSLEADKYSAYLFGNRGIVHVQNKDNPNGPKVLFIKDSLAVPLAAFLSTVCSDVYLVDPRYYKDDIPSYVNGIKDLDFVFMSFSPQDLTEEFFPFYKE
ncbi:alginate O-acetyltransferase AlgX-related protein [Clostridium chromiireducens]|uniref:alginate O-acetyltransferase AlgX-related protein n=1 Tax=Clostridium chromiireducens TaxID=225345 RepID=UPI003AF57DB5